MATQQPAFRIRWGKLSLALVGVLALLAVPVTFVVACFTSLSFFTPLICLALFALSFVALRTSAIRERRRRAWERATFAVPDEQVAAKESESVDDELAKVDAAEAAKSSGAESASVAESVPEDSKTQPVAQESVVEEAFDIEAPARSAASAASAAAAEDETSESMAQVDAGQTEAGQTDANHDAAQATSQRDERTAVGQEAGLKTKQETWSPREVPAPTYTTAQPVERELPESLVVPEDKKPTEVTSIRKAERDRADQERTAGAEDVVRDAKAQIAKSKLDLDAVLQRRRA
jgi:hypothetical protein